MTSARGLTIAEVPMSTQRSLERAFLLLCVLCLTFWATAESSADWEKRKRDFLRDFSSHDLGIRLEAVTRVGDADSAESCQLLVGLFGALQNEISPVEMRKAALLEDIGKLEKQVANAARGQKGPVVQVPAEIVEKLRVKKAELDALNEDLSGRRKIRQAVVAALGKARSPAAVSWLLDRGLSRSAWEEKAGVAEALGWVEADGVVEALAALRAKDSDSRIRVAAAQALGKQTKPVSIEPLVEALADDSWVVRIAAVQGLSRWVSRRAVSALVEALAKEDGRLTGEVNAALQKITGQNFHRDPHAWKEWLDRNLSELPAEPVLAEASKSPEHEEGGRGTGGEASAENATVFYGIVTYSKRVLFIVDTSGSMAAPAGSRFAESGPGTGSLPDGTPPPGKGATKWDWARYELKRAILGLAQDAHFNIIFFNHVPRAWKPGLVPASRNTKLEALSEVQKISPEGGTNIFDSLRLAFESGAKGGKGGQEYRFLPDTIFFLTDGKPTHGEERDTKRILERVRELNKLRQIVLHVIGVGDKVDSNPENPEGIDEEFLKQLAEQNGGRYVRR